MANTKQALKMIRKTKRRTAHNRMWKNRIKEAIKTLDEIVAQPETETAKVSESYQNLQKVIDKAQKKGVIDSNKANRIKSRKSKQLKKEDKKTN